MAESLTNKTIKGVGWNAIDRFANYGIAFIVGIVLARLLSPDDYGLIGIITIFTSIFNIILDGGFSTALIRKEGVSDIDYSTVFISNFLIAIGLTALLYTGAPIIAYFFERDELIPLIRAISFILIIDSFSVTQQALLTKRLDFKLQTKISLISHITSGAIGIFLAFKGFGVWALVIQQLTSRFLIAVLLVFFNKWFPKQGFSWTCFKELFGFGWKLLLSRVLNSVWGNFYNAVIGKIYSPTVLGLYTRATQYGNLFSSEIGDVVLKVSLPVMSTIQSDEDRLINGTRLIIKVTMFVTFILTFGLIAVAKSFIYILIGEKWLDCVPFLQIVCFNLMMNPLSYINENLLTVKGKSDKILILQFFRIALSIIPVLFGIYFNIYWMLISSAIISWLSIYLFTYFTGKYYGYKWYHQLKDITPSLLVSLSMAAPVYLLSFLPISDYIIFPIQMICGIIILYTVCERTQLNEYLYLKNIAIEKVFKKRKTH